MRQIKRFAVSLVLALGAIWSLGAQNRVVTGVVQDTGGAPVVGAVVMVPGTNNADVTGADGAFSIRVADAQVALEVSCLGYVTAQVNVPASQSRVDVVLQEDQMMLEETVVVGYGVQKKVNLTGAVTAVDTKELADRTTHNLTNMLQGAVPGLNISTSSGNPGSAGSLNIRGITSINAADPLVLIDGTEGDLSRVNAADVENISVIKDASAAAIYGARAAYGVILVTTKTGTDKGGKAKVRYSGRWGWEEPTVSTDFETRGYWSVYTVDKFWATDAGKNYTNYTAHDMAELLARVNDKTENPARPWVVEEVRNGRKQWIYYANTDWYHELYNDKHPVIQQNVSVTGGNKDVKYYLSGAYDRQSGIIKVNPDVFQKFNLRAKIDARINKYGFIEAPYRVVDNSDPENPRVTNDVVYQYELNTQDKTIRYTFGPMNGQGRYWFSDDRQYLVITDGDQFTSTGTAVDDLLRQFRELIDTAQGHETALPAGEGIIAFSREPDAKALEKERADAEAKKKAEEEARKAEERRAAEEAAAQAAEYEEGNYEEEPAGEEAPAEEPPAEERPAEENNGNE